MMDARFDHVANIAQATRYKGNRNYFWPPLGQYTVHALDIAGFADSVPHEITAELDVLRDLIEAEWSTCKARGAPSRTRMHAAEAIAACLRRIAPALPHEQDRQALELRADAVESGYDEAALAALAEIEEETALVAGQIATWYGKQTGGLPTAFGCVRDHAKSQAVATARRLDDEAATYLRGLHAWLRLGDVPAFAPVNVFFMAGEGDRHPKHIAYFLPEDEGVKRSPFKKTYYFANTHDALVENMSLPLASRYLDLGRDQPVDLAALGSIPALGVLAHEMGHFVHREGRSFAPLNAADRWASVMLQEISADGFGILIVAEVLAPRMGLSRDDVIFYHLAECLRYVDRGFGYFPDCDGMALQLGYLLAFGALELVEEEGAPRLKGEAGTVLAGLRSLARVLADTLLDEDVDRSLALVRDFGPASQQLEPLLTALSAQPVKTIHYVQEWPSPARLPLAAAG